LDGYLIRRAVECATITYDQLKTGSCLSALPTGLRGRYQIRRAHVVLTSSLCRWRWGQGVTS
jgi:hypothetical protein